MEIFSENASKTGGLGVPPLPSGVVPLLLPSCFSWYLKSVYGSVSCLLLPSAAVCSARCQRAVASNKVVGCVWHASDDRIFSSGGLPPPALLCCFCCWDEGLGFLELSELVTVECSLVSEVNLPCRPHHRGHLGN